MSSSGHVAAARALWGLEGDEVALPLLRVVDRGGPLWPWAAERIGLALVLLRQSRP